MEFYLGETKHLKVSKSTIYKFTKGNLLRHRATPWLWTTADRFTEALIAHHTGCILPVSEIGLARTVARSPRDDTRGSPATCPSAPKSHPNIQQLLPMNSGLQGFREHPQLEAPALLTRIVSSSQCSRQTKFRSAAAAFNAGAVPRASSARQMPGAARQP